MQSPARPGYPAIAPFADPYGNGAYQGRGGTFSHTHATHTRATHTRHTHAPHTRATHTRDNTQHLCALATNTDTVAAIGD